MTNSWMNEDGEPIMDGAAWRFEQSLDADTLAQRWEFDDDLYGPEYGDWDNDDCVATGQHGTDADGESDGTWTCSLCGEPCDGPEDNEPEVMEDQWLDDSWEE